MRNRMTTRMLLLLVPLAGCGGSEAEAGSGQSQVPLYDNLGSHHVPISTQVPLAQEYFDQGMRLYYAFNHVEAIRAFAEAARLDPSCAICFWGSALAYGPNINLPMDAESGLAAFDALQRAQAAASGANARERSLIDALATRYEPQPREERAALDSAYARAMRAVVDRHPDDIEARALYAEALMDLSPWNYWEADGSPRPDTPEVLAHLEGVLAENPDHPGANHFYIHAVEAVDPWRAVPMAERLAGLMPGAGHMVHMPGHIYIRVGRYQDAIRANEHAVHADETYIQDQQPGLGVYTAGYYPHNYDFLAFAASMIGRSGQAIDAAERMTTLTPEELVYAPGMAFLQHHRTRHLQMKVRFGRWDDILATPAPAADLPHARAVWQYARGRAFAARGDLTAAEAELEAVRAALRNPDLADIPLEFNSSVDVLRIASEILAGAIASARGDHTRAVEHGHNAVRLEDALVYGEPPDWTVPVRHDLGEFQLRAGLAAEAERTFREDLAHFPENGWSLNGLARALREQGRTSDADASMARFRQVWEGSDLPI
jgi:tetratricopeptide (TPR) repeat protein